MSSKRYTKEFKVEAVKQVTDRGHSARKSPPGWSCRSTAFTLGGNSTAAPDRRRQRRRTGPKRCAGSGRSLAGLRKERDILKSRGVRSGGASRTQYTGHSWQDFLKAHGLVSSMSRRGSCHDNAVAESFFQLLKRERIKRRIYANGDDARSDVFNSIEMFYNTGGSTATTKGSAPVDV